MKWEFLAKLSLWKHLYEERRSTEISGTNSILVGIFWIRMPRFQAMLTRVWYEHVGKALLLIAHRSVTLSLWKTGKEDIYTNVKHLRKNKDRDG